MNYDEFANLPDRVKIEARLSWLERKVLDALWLLIALTSALAGIVIGWLFGAIVGNQSLWLLVPVSVCISLGVGWLLKQRTFNDAPPHIELIDP